MSGAILLCDIFGFEKLLAQYPGKRIKLRFNTSWNDTNLAGKIVRRDFKEMYIDKNPELYQQILSMGSESKKRLANNDIVFQFIKINDPDIWLFIGAYNVIDAQVGSDGFNNITKKKFKYATTEKLSQYDKYAGRITVNWKNKPQQFYYIGTDIINEIAVREIFTEHYLISADEFPGYENICKSYSELKRCIKKDEWKTALSNVYGVYVITDTATGKQYVGSAYGDDGILGRWSVYLKDGYDKTEQQGGEYPNKQLKDLVKKQGIKYISDNFQYAILEIFPKTDIGRKKSIERESYWKEVMQTRNFGYNDN